MQIGRCRADEAAGVYIDVKFHSAGGALSKARRHHTVAGQSFFEP